MAQNWMPLVVFRETSPLPRLAKDVMVCVK